MLLCDGCDCGTANLHRHISFDHVSFFKGFHMFCLDPPLNSIPKDQWFCHTCLFETGGDFGFDEGEEHSLSSFQARDLEFRRRWWASHLPAHTSPPDLNDPTVNYVGNVLVTESDVENEFWRLVQSPNDTVEIEYGADVHSTTHGRYVAGDLFCNFPPLNILDTSTIVPCLPWRRIPLILLPRILGI